MKYSFSRLSTNEILSPRANISYMDAETSQGTSASLEIDAIIAKASDWKGEKLSQLRTLIRQAYPAVVEEVKWKKPSKPEGVPVWSYDGILCNADILKHVVRLTFHKGAQIPDPKKLFNTRLDSQTVRAIDFRAEDEVELEGFQALILEAVRVNVAKVSKR